MLCILGRARSIGSKRQMFHSSRICMSCCYQVVPAVGLHAFVAVSHSGGQKHGRVLRLSTATAQLEQGLFRTNVARPLTVLPTLAHDPHLASQTCLH